MDISFRCACGRSLTVDESAAGMVVQCPTCGSNLTVPQPPPQAQIPKPRAVQSVPKLAPTPVREVYYLQIQGESKGPFTMGQLKGMWQSGQVTADAKYRKPDSEEWRPILEITSTLEESVAPRTLDAELAPASHINAQAASTTNRKSSPLRKLGVFLIVVGLISSGIGILHSQEDSYETMLTSNIASSERDVHNLKAAAEFIEAQGAQRPALSSQLTDTLDDWKAKLRDVREERTTKRNLFLGAGIVLFVVGLVCLSAANERHASN